MATAANLTQKRRDRTKIDRGKARKQRKIEEYQSRIRECISDGTTIDNIAEKIIQSAEILPRKEKLNRASRWWTSGLTELRRACLTAQEAWKVAESHEKEQAERLFRQEKKMYLKEQKRRRISREVQEDKKLEHQCHQLDPLYYQFMNCSRTNRSICRLKVQGQELFRPTEIAQAFLEHFIRVGQSLVHEEFETEWKRTVDGVVKSVCSPYEENINHLEHIKEIIESEVTEAVKKLK